MGAIPVRDTLIFSYRAAKTIRKYIIWPTDSAFIRVYNNTDTNMILLVPYNGTKMYDVLNRGLFKGSNNDSDWTTSIP